MHEIAQKTCIQIFSNVYPISIIGTSAQCTLNVCAIKKNTQYLRSDILNKIFITETTLIF